MYHYKNSRYHLIAQLNRSAQTVFENLYEGSHGMLDKEFRSGLLRLTVQKVVTAINVTTLVKHHFATAVRQFTQHHRRTIPELIRYLPRNIHKNKYLPGIFLGQETSKHSNLCQAFLLLPVYGGLSSHLHANVTQIYLRRWAVTHQVTPHPNLGNSQTHLPSTAIRIPDRDTLRPHSVRLLHTAPNICDSILPSPANTLCINFKNTITQPDRSQPRNETTEFFFQLQTSSKDTATLAITQRPRDILSVKSYSVEIYEHVHDFREFYVSLPSQIVYTRKYR